jgi:hypothetical protein
VCGICKGNPERRKFVNAELRAGTSQLEIERKSRSLGFPVKRETVRHHLRTCVAQGIEDQPLAAIIKMPKGTPGPIGRPPIPTDHFTDLPATDDFALLVRDAAIQKLKAGELRIGTQDGLNAQNLLDRREEKKKDRDLLGQLGRLLAGQTSAPPPMIIEGHAEQIE